MRFSRPAPNSCSAGELSIFGLSNFGVGDGSWPCENSSARRTRRNISEQLHFRESNHTAYARFDALLENCFFYIWRMYEFLHSQGHSRSFGDVCSMSGLDRFSDSSRTSPKVRVV